MSVYEIFLFVHVIAFVYWLGADIGVFYAAGYAVKPELSRETRLTVIEIMAWVDQFPRVCVPTIAAVGAVVGVAGGYFVFDPAWLWLVGAIALGWVAMILYLYVNRRKPEKIGWLATVDVWFRTGVLIVVAGLGVAALAGRGVTDQPWLAIKLLIFALAILFSLMTRFLFHPFKLASARLRAGTSTAQDDADMRRALARARLPILGIWAMTLAAAAIGLWKPV